MVFRYVLGIGLFGVAAAVGGCGNDDEPPAAAPKAAAVTSPVKEIELATVTITPEAEQRLAIATTPVEQRATARARTVGGEIIAAGGARQAITAPVPGTLASAGMLPVPGAVVTRGQALFRLVPIQASERNAVVDAQQAADTAAARRDLAAQQVQRAKQLLTDGSGSRRALEEAEAALAIADAELKAARERVALSGRSGTSETGVTLQAPETAIVQAVYVREGQAVAAATPLIDLVRLATVWVRVPIYAGESADIESAAPADVLALGSPPDAKGARARPIPAPPTANATTAGVDLYYELANGSQQFRPGERVAVRLIRRGTASSTVVPKAALLHDAFGGTWVYVARGPQTYARQRVAVTDISGDLAVLAQGPAVGARVVTDGAAELFGVEFGAGK